MDGRKRFREESLEMQPGGWKQCIYSIVIRLRRSRAKVGRLGEGMGERRQRLDCSKGGRQCIVAEKGLR